MIAAATHTGFGIHENNSSRQGQTAILPFKNYSTVVRLFPIVFFIGYLTFTVILFAVGPWDWPILDGSKLYIFLGLAHVALFLGYYTAAFRKPCGYSRQFSVYKVIRWTIVVNLILLFPTVAFRTGSFTPDIAAALANPGAAYTNSLTTRDANTPVIEYIRLCVGPFIALFLPVVIFYWRFIRPFARTLAMVVLFGTVALFIAMGTNKAIADTVLLLPWLVFAAHCAGIIRLSARKWILGGLAALVSFALFLSFFSLTMSTRTGASPFYGYFPAIGMRADPNNFLIKDASPPVKIGVLGLDSYMTQGYYALYLSLEEPFVPMFGVGNSFFLTHQAVRITNDPEIERLSYPARIEKHGWNAFGLWSSIYPWIASDVSFPGTILVVFLIGRLFALSWLDTLDGTNPFAVAVFAQFVIMLFYFPANNQILQSGEGFTGLVGTFCLWLFTRKRYNQVQLRQPARLETA